MNILLLPFLSLHPSQYSPSFNVAAWLRRREKGGRNYQEIPQECCVFCGQRWTSFPLELGIETNIVCSYNQAVLRWNLSLGLLFFFYLPFFFTPLLCKSGERMHTEKMSLFNSVCLLALGIQYVIKFSISNGERQHSTINVPYLLTLKAITA